MSFPRKAFANIVGGAILLGVLIFAFVTMFSIGFKRYFTLQSSVIANMRVLEERMHTNLNIINDTVNKSVGCYILVNNTGSTKLKLNCITLYVDNVYWNDFSFSIINDYTNPNIWDPGETVEISFTSCPPLGLHYIKVVSCNGAGTSRYVNFVT